MLGLENIALQLVSMTLPSVWLCHKLLTSLSPFPPVTRKSSSQAVCVCVCKVRDPLFPGHPYPGSGDTLDISKGACGLKVECRA